MLKTNAVILNFL